MSLTQFRPIKTPIDTFFFDCDSTLSLIEGIDVLAELNGVDDRVQKITHRCMSKTGLNSNDYRKRLELVQPNLEQLKILGEEYVLHLTPGAKESIHILSALNKKVFILSAGIKSSIVPLAHHLGIAEDHVLAVDVYLNPNGTYKGFNEKSHLIRRFGKSKVIQSILSLNQTSLLVGDGLSDWEARNAVNRFIGFAGVNGKKWLNDHSPIYIATDNLFPLIPLSLTEEETNQLNQEFYSFYQLGLEQILNGSVLIRENHDDICSNF